MEFLSDQTARYIPKRGKKIGGEEVQYIDQVDLMQVPGIGWPASSARECRSVFFELDTKGSSSEPENLQAQKLVCLEAQERH